MLIEPSETQTKRPRKAASVRREEILRAAAQVFAEHGFRCADVQQVADLAGIGKGTVYRFYPTKDELFQASVDHVMQRLIAQVDAAAEAALAPLEKLRAAFLAHLAFFEQHPEAIELFVHERAELKEGAKPLYFVYSAARRGNWIAICEQMIEAGECRITDPQLIINAFGTLAYGSMLANRMSAYEPSSGLAADALLDVLLNGIMKTPREPARLPDGAAHI